MNSAQVKQTDTMCFINPPHTVISQRPGCRSSSPYVGFTVVDGGFRIGPPCVTVPDLAIPELSSSGCWSFGDAVNCQRALEFVAAAKLPLNRLDHQQQ